MFSIAHSENNLYYFHSNFIKITQFVNYYNDYAILSNAYSDNDIKCAFYFRISIFIEFYLKIQNIC